MGKITRVEMADMIVCVTGKFLVESMKESDLKMIREGILGHVSSYIGFGLQGRKLFREMVIDIVIKPEFEISEDKKPQDLVKIQILVNKNDEKIRSFIKGKEKNIIAQLTDHLNVEKVEFDYDAVCESIRWEC